MHSLHSIREDRSGSVVGEPFRSTGRFRMVSATEGGVENGWRGRRLWVSRSKQKDKHYPRIHRLRFGTAGPSKATVSPIT